MKKGCLIALIVTVAVVLIVGIGMYSFIKNTYNNMVTLEENVTQKWAQVENVYQRRADLIPNLVEVVKGYANFERETLEGPEIDILMAGKKLPPFQSNPPSNNQEPTDRKEEEETSDSDDEVVPLSKQTTDIA